MIFHIQSDEELNQKIENAGEKLVVIDFFATWCGPCKMVSPKLEELSELYSPNVIVLKVDVDECDDIAHKYRITCMPTFLFIRKKKLLDVLIGGNSERLTISMENLVYDQHMEKVMADTELAMETLTLEQAGENI